MKAKFSKDDVEGAKAWGTGKQKVDSLDYLMWDVDRLHKQIRSAERDAWGPDCVRSHICCICATDTVMHLCLHGQGRLAKGRLAKRRYWGPIACNFMAVSFAPLTFLCTCVCKRRSAPLGAAPDCVRLFALDRMLQGWLMRSVLERSEHASTGTLTLATASSLACQPMLRHHLALPVP